MRQQKRHLHGLRCSGILPGCVLILTMLLGMVSVQAAESGSGEYTYTIRVYGGAYGTVSSEVNSNKKDGETVTCTIQQNTGSIYDIVKGVRESGREDSYLYTATQTGADTYTVSVPVSPFGQPRDRDYVVVYGVKGSTVKYTVNYVDVNGRSLAASETFYGNEGDKPIIAYKYIEGYYPNTRNLTKTAGLSQDETQNVFNFVYQQNPVAAPTVTPAPVAPVVTPAGTAGTAAGTNGTGLIGPDNTATAGNAGTGEQGTIGTGQTDTGNTAGTGNQGAASGVTGLNGPDNTAGGEVQSTPEIAGVNPETLPSSPDEVPEIIDIDDETVPLAGVNGTGLQNSAGNENKTGVNGTDTDTDDSDGEGTQKGLSKTMIALIAAAAAAVIVIILAARYLAGSRKIDEE